MIWLGIGLFFGLHIIPSLPGFRTQLISRMGAGGYKGAFALIALTGLVFLGLGYTRMEYLELWSTPDWASYLALAVMSVAFIFWVAAEMKGHIRKTIKHPMIIGVLLWSVVHLVNNGDRASLYLFGSFALFSVFSIISSNRRGKFFDYPSPNARHDVIAIILGAALFSAVLWGHDYLFGVAPVF
jgi:uncharacterized membrane protein